MGLQLKKDGGEYRRIWYANICEQGRHVTRKLITPLRGKIPLDESGRFSLSLKGDDAFERSRAAALGELNDIITKAKVAKAEERREPGWTERQVLRKLTSKDFAMVRLDELAERNAERSRYKLLAAGDKDPEDGHPITEKEAKDANKYNQSVKDILEHFAKWAAAYSADKPSRDKCTLITDVTTAIAADYYKSIAEDFSWQTFRKYVFILKNAFAHFVPGVNDNPFEEAYKDAYTYKKNAIDKTEVVHEAPTAEQIRRIWEYTRTRKDKPYLHRLAVLAVCTGMRIGDCCTLTWDKVDLLDFKIRTKTKKTGKQIGVQIFDYRPDSADYHETLGELRRELEAANVEAARDERYVIPEAARIYRANPSRINKEGKEIFARALFADPEPSPAVLVGDETEKKTPAEILVAIEAASIPAKRKAVIRTIYELHSTGSGYTEIAKKVGKRKGFVSEALAWVERLTGESIRPGNPYIGENAKVGIKHLLAKTRAERKQGQRSACLYGWHSFRVSFAVMSLGMGVKPEDLKEMLGHATVKMVLHYYNPQELAAAENMRMINRVRNQAKRTETAVAALPPPAEDIPTRLKKLDALLSAGIITQAERDEQRTRILAEI